MRRIEQWGLVPILPSPFSAPEQTQGMAVTGFVYGYPGKPDGTPITTNIVKHAGDEPDTVMTKSGSTYLLGVVDPVYENQFPNARERFFNTLPKKP